MQQLQAATCNLVLAPLDPDEQLFEWCMAAPALLRGGGHRPWHRHINHVWLVRGSRVARQLAPVRPCSLPIAAL